MEAITTLASACTDRALDIVHVGGELLTCDAWDAAVMLSPSQQATPIFEAQSAQLQTPAEWAQEHIGRATRAPYVLSKAHFPLIRSVFFNAIGGVGFERQDPMMAAEVIDALEQADDVTVRDTITQKALHEVGITTRLLPDPAVMVAELFSDIIRDRAACEAVASIRDACANGYIAVQFSADFGDDRTLDTIAAQLDVVAATHGFGVAFFCAGIAAWHDAPEVYERTRQRMHTASVHIMASPNIWDICALIANSRAYCGSSLHGRIVAAAFALPHVNIRHPTRVAGPSKQTAYATTWEGTEQAGEVRVDEIVRGIEAAIKVEPARLRHTARTLVDAYRSGFQRVSALLL